jgi:hypothetical protein
MVGTFWGEKSLKALSNNVFRFIQQALISAAWKHKEIENSRAIHLLSVSPISCNLLFNPDRLLYCS